MLSNLLCFQSHAVKVSQGLKLFKTINYSNEYYVSLVLKVFSLQMCIRITCNFALIRNTHAISMLQSLKNISFIGAILTHSMDICMHKCILSLKNCFLIPSII